MDERFQQIQATTSMGPSSNKKQLPEVNGFIQGKCGGYWVSTITTSISHLCNVTLCDSLQIILNSIFSLWFLVHYVIQTIHQLNNVVNMSQHRGYASHTSPQESMARALMPSLPLLGVAMDIDGLEIGLKGIGGAMRGFDP